MKVSLRNICALSLFVFLVICSIGHVVFQVLCIFLFGMGMVIFKGIDGNKNFNVFYLSLIALSVVQLLLFYKNDYSINYLINTLLITFMWVLAYLAHNFITNSIKILTIETIDGLLNKFFNINMVLIIIQYIIVCFESNSIFPFGVEKFGMSTGDYLKGFFVNSSVNMVIMSFFATYYFFKRRTLKTTLALVLMTLTTYMSGIILGLVTISIYGFFMFNLKNKIKITLTIIVGIYLFSVISPENVKYVMAVFQEKISSTTDPARKIVSFEQTATNFISSPSSFLFGEGGGKFSSRTAYLTGGEYVDWYPEKLIYRSEKFENNHFQLWNNKALSIPYRDGTANQPFSFYNKIVGEYGFFGILLFAIYLLPFFNKRHYLTHGKLIVPLMLAFFLLDYWFEYFTVVLFFELFMLLDIKANQQLIESLAERKVINNNPVDER